MNSRIKGLSLLQWLHRREKQDFLKESGVFMRSKLNLTKIIPTLMFLESVNNIATLSIPIPQPAVGGKPYSSERQKVSSTN